LGTEDSHPALLGLPLLQCVQDQHEYKYGCLTGKQVLVEDSIGYFYSYQRQALFVNLINIKEGGKS
jgi:hypothetical protein